MAERDEADLGRRLETDPGGDGAGPRACGLCGDQVDGDPVEVRLDRTRSPDPDAWLCSDCYEHVVGDLGIAPIRVFKTGPRRTVVLPARAGGGAE